MSAGEHGGTEARRMPSTGLHGPTGRAIVLLDGIHGRKTLVLLLPYIMNRGMPCHSISGMEILGKGGCNALNTFRAFHREEGSGDPTAFLVQHIESLAGMGRGHDVYCYTTFVQTGH